MKILRPDRNDKQRFTRPLCQSCCIDAFLSYNILHSLKHLLKSFVKFMKQKWWVESRGRESKLLISKKSKTQANYRSEQEGLRNSTGSNSFFSPMGSSEGRLDGNRATVCTVIKQEHSVLETSLSRWKTMLN